MLANLHKGGGGGEDGFLYNSEKNNISSQKILKTFSA